MNIKIDENVNSWHLNGQLRRTDGTAIEDLDAYKEWYLNGQQMPFEQWLDNIKQDGNNMEEQHSTLTFCVPELSEWKCYLFGNTPESNSGLVWQPIKGQEPNWFIRWMMKLCFACTWVKGN